MNFMFYTQNPFPHDDGAPASLQDVLDEKAAAESMRQSQQSVNDFLKMILSTMK